jgi:hypothetical protein
MTSVAMVTLSSLVAFAAVAWLGTRIAVAIWPGSLPAPTALGGAACSTLVFLHCPALHHEVPDQQRGTGGVTEGQ